MDSIGKPSSSTPDLSFLKEMLGDDKETLNEVLLIFLEEGPTLLAQLERAGQEKDHRSLNEITHKMIAELTTVGVTSVVYDLKRINKSSREMVDLDKVIERVTKVVNDSFEYFKTIVLDIS